MPETNAPQSSNRFLIAFIAVLLVCLVVSKFLGSDSEKPKAGATSTSETSINRTFTGEPALSISGLTLAQSWDQMDETRDWEDRQNTILSSYLEGGHLTVRFDADKTLKYIYGPEVALNGKPLFTTRTKMDDVLSRFGEPSKRTKRELTYVYDDAGQKCALSLTFQDRSGHFDHRTGQEIAAGSYLDRAQLSLAGSRWEGSPSLPILGR